MAAAVGAVELGRLDWGGRAGRGARRPWRSSRGWVLGLGWLVGCLGAGRGVRAGARRRRRGDGLGGEGRSVYSHVFYASQTQFWFLRVHLGRVFRSLPCTEGESLAPARRRWRSGWRAPDCINARVSVSGALSYAAASSELKSEAVWCSTDDTSLGMTCDGDA